MGILGIISTISLLIITCLLALIYKKIDSAITKQIKEEVLKSVPKNGVEFERAQKDRDYLLLFMARSFFAANKLSLEKKHPSSDQIILVFQTKVGNLRFSIKDELLPEEIRPSTATYSSEKINIKENYKLIEEIIHQKEGQ